MVDFYMSIYSLGFFKWRLLYDCMPVWLYMFIVLKNVTLDQGINL